MSILIDEFKSLENELVNKVLFFALGCDYSKEVDKAKHLFRRILDKNNYSYDDKDFTSWLIWEYKIDNRNNFFEEYIRVIGSKLTENQYKILEELSNTYLSIYEIVDLKEKKKLIDIFLKKEFIIEEGLEKVNPNQLLIGRVIKYDEQNYVLDEYSTLDKRFQNGIEKVFYEEFESYKEKNSFSKIEEFIRDKSILINSFTNIIDDITKKQMGSSNEYNVYQSNYAVLDHKKLCDSLLKSTKIEFDYEENSALFYIMYKEGEKGVLGEIVLFKDKLEIECISDRDSDNAKRIIEEVASNTIKYMSDEMITLDDLLT